MKRLLLMLAVLIAAGCKPPQPNKPVNYSQELPPGALALRKLSPEEYPDFSQAVRAPNTDRLARAIDFSLEYLAKPSSRKFYPYGDITHERAVATLVALKQVLATDSGDPHAFDLKIKQDFEVYQSVGGTDTSNGKYTGDVLFTAYFTPTYNASLTRSERFRFPIYKRPADLQTDAAGEHAWRQMPDGTTAPYSTRAQIEQGHALDGQELVWLDDRFNAYVVTVQGSARLQLNDGRIYEVGYAGNNGYAYVSPGKQMLADGVISKDELTLAGLRKYFAENPRTMDKYLNLNDREVFFSPTTGGPFGCLSEPVTPLATIATDKSIYPRAMPAFLVAPMPAGDGNSHPFRGFMLDQDAGGAIRAAGRCDIYYGVGEQAGQELNVGQLYYLAIRPDLTSSTGVLRVTGTH